MLMQLQRLNIVLLDVVIALCTSIGLLVAVLVLLFTMGVIVELSGKWLCRLYNRTVVK